MSSLKCVFIVFLETNKMLRFLVYKNKSGSNNNYLHITFILGMRGYRNSGSSNDIGKLLNFLVLFQQIKFTPE